MSLHRGQLRHSTTRGDPETVIHYINRPRPTEGHRENQAPRDWVASVNAADCRWLTFPDSHQTTVLKTSIYLMFVTLKVMPVWLIMAMPHFGGSTPPKHCATLNGPPL